MNTALRDDGHQRLYERLADCLDSRDRDGPEQPLDVAPDADHQVAAAVADYFDAVAVVDRFAAPLRELAANNRSAWVPSRLGDYELLEEIGRGGTAIVYRARQRGLNRLVAIKVVRGGRAGSLYDVERIRFEAEAVAHLEHPGIVPIYEIGEHEGRPWFSMKLYAGGSLAGRLNDFRDRPRHAAELVQSIAHAVHHAHQRGILHRDLKPSNILLDAEGRPHVADFGLAKRLEGDPELTHTGELIGTPAYIAPERIDGTPWFGPATIATDVYGLGGVLYALLAGRPPFHADSSIRLLVAASTEDPAPPATLNPRVDRDLETICLKCLEKDPGRRYPSALELARDLERWQAGEPIAARQIGRVERVRRWCRRRPVRAVAVLAATVLAAIGVIGLAAGYVLVSRANAIAEGHRVSAEEKAAELIQRLYVSEMSLGFRHRERADLDELKSLLDRFRDERQIAGFEWRWLDRQARLMPPELARCTGHEHILYCGTFSPDGRTVATCGADATIRLWDAETGAVQQVLQTGAGRSLIGEKWDENCVQFSPDGTLLASSCEDGTVRLWTLADGDRHDLLPVPPKETYSATFSVDGKWLVAASLDGIVRVWDVACRTLVTEFTEDGAPAQRAVFSPDGREVASTDRAGNLLVWDRESGRVRARLQSGANMQCVAWSPDGRLIATEGAGGTLVLWDAAGGAEAAALPAASSLRSCVFSPDGTRLACCGDDGCVRIWSLPDGALRRCFKAHTGIAWCLQFAPDGQRLLTVSSDRTARVWDVPPRDSIDVPTTVTTALRHLTFAPDSRSLALVTAEGEVRIGDGTDARPWQTLPARASNIAPPAFSPDGSELAFLGSNREVQRWRCLERRLLPSFQPLPGDRELNLGATRLAYLPDGRLAAATSRGSLFLCESGRWRECSAERSGIGHARLLAPIGGGRSLALCDLEPSRVEFWNIERNEFEGGLDCDGVLDTGDVSRDGKWLAWAHGHGAIEIIDLRSPDRRKVLVGHRSLARGLAFSADSRTLASVGVDGTVRLWNVATGLEMFVLETRRQPVHAVAFSPDGTRLAVGGDPRDDGTTLSIYRTDNAP